MTTHLEVVPAEGEHHTETAEITVEERLAQVEQRLAALEQMAHNTHSIAPETIEAILQQAYERMSDHMHKAADILKVLK